MLCFVYDTDEEALEKIECVENFIAITNYIKEIIADKEDGIYGDWQLTRETVLDCFEIDAESYIIYGDSKRIETSYGLDLDKKYKAIILKIYDWVTQVK